MNELDHLKQALLSYRYSSREIESALELRRQTWSYTSILSTEEAYLPSILLEPDEIEKLLKGHNIEPVGKSMKNWDKSKEVLRMNMDKIDSLCKAGVHKMPCNYKKFRSRLLSSETRAVTLFRTVIYNTISI